MSVRPVLKIVKGMPASDGDGVRLTRMLGTPEAQMFDPFLMLDCFDNDQASDYSRRKGVPIAEVERWLAPYLGYEPQREVAEPETA